MGNKLANVERSVQLFAEKLDRLESRRQGDIVLIFTGEDAGRLVVRTRDKSTVTTRIGRKAPLAEVRGNPAKIKALLDGEKEARKAFLEGDIRVRGDIDYLVTIVRELGLIS